MSMAQEPVSDETVTIRRTLVLKPIPEKQRDLLGMLKVSCGTTMFGMFVGGLLGAVRGGLVVRGALQFGFLTFPSSVVYLVVRDTLSSEELAPAIPSMFAGWVSGAFFCMSASLISSNLQAYFLAITNEKIVNKTRFTQRGSLAGAVFGYGGSLANSYFHLWSERRQLRKQAEHDQRAEVFLEDKEKLGDRAYDIVHKDKKISWIPSWFPIQSMPDKEYEAYLKDKLDKSEADKKWREDQRIAQEAKLQVQKEKTKGVS